MKIYFTLKKYLFLLPILLISLISVAQFPNIQNNGSPNTLTLARGANGSDSGYVYRYAFPDTATANRGFIKNIPGIQIRVIDTLFLRNYNATKWLNIAPGDSSSNGVQSVTGYNVDNTDPINPVILSTMVDGTTIIGTGTAGDPFIALIGGDPPIIGIDSIRRLPGTVFVEARKNNIWRRQFIDSVGVGDTTGVETVTGYNVNNADPENPVILPVQVDPNTITGTGVVGDPFIAVTGGTANIGIDSLRRIAGSTQVEGRKNGTWRVQFIDSVGSGNDPPEDSTHYFDVEQIDDSSFTIIRVNGTRDTIVIRTGAGNPSVIPRACSGLLDGGFVTWNGTGLIFDVTDAIFCVNNIQYNSEADQVTLAVADATFDRFDVIAVDTLGNVVVIQGTPSADPQIPQIDPSYQVYLDAILVMTNATTPPQTGNFAITDEVIYKENIEWVGSSNVGGENFAYAVNPYEGTLSTLTPTVTNNNFVRYTTDSAINITDFTYLRLYIRLNATFNSSTFLNISFRTGANIVRANLSLLDGSYGFSRTRVNQWQLIVIPIENFPIGAFNSAVDNMNITLSGTAGTSFQLDNIVLQRGGVNYNSIIPPLDQVTGRDSVTTHNILFQNFAPAPATGATPNSPIAEWLANSRDTINNLSILSKFGAFLQTARGGAAPTYSLRFRAGINTFPLSLSSTGAATFANGLILDGSNRIFGSSTINVQGGSTSLLLNVSNAIGTTFTGTLARFSMGNSIMAAGTKVLTAWGDRNAEIFTVQSSGQIGINNVSPNTKTVLDAASLGRGIMIPRMNTAQRNGIPQRVATVSITSGGSGYVTAPTPQIPASPVGGLNGEATATVSGGVVNTLTLLFGGTGYSAGGSLTFNNTGTGGTGAAGTFTVTTDTIPWGMIIWNTDSSCIEIYRNSTLGWKTLCSVSGGGAAIDTTNRFVNSVTGINDSTIRVFKGATSTDIVIKGGVGSGSGSNFANGNLILTGDRVHDFDNHAMTWNDFETVDFDGSESRLYLGNNGDGAYLLTSDGTIQSSVSLTPQYAALESSRLAAPTTHRIAAYPDSIQITAGNITPSAPFISIPLLPTDNTAEMAAGFKGNRLVKIDKASGGSGETNTASNLGGGVANYSTKVGVDLRFNSFNSSQFSLASNVISMIPETWNTYGLLKVRPDSLVNKGIPNTIAYAGSDSILTTSSNLSYNGTNISVGANAIPTFLSATATLNFGSIAAGAFEDLTVTVTGAALSDVVTIGIPNGAITADNITFTAWVSASNTITVRCGNGNLSGASNPASGSYKIKVLQ